MENLKKSRATLRGLFTKAVNKLEEVLNAERLSRKDLNMHLANVEQKAEQIADLDRQINALMLANPIITEEELEQEYDSRYIYETKMNQCKCSVEEILAVNTEKNLSESGHSSVFQIASTGKAKKYKLPKIEFTKFGGELKEWLSFWSQFEKIHNDCELADEDKFHYLRQSTIENSKAREVVDSFPMTGANYPKVISHLTNRFGNKDTLVEVYVRELLKLVLSNTLNPTKKIIVSSLYDKLEAQLRSLESLGVTRDKFGAILYPLVESCLPEDILRVWQRHRIVPTNAEEEGEDITKTDRLTHLMMFLRSEVESEERITLARTGFTEQSKKVHKKEDKTNDVPTAAGLFVGSKNKSKCIFCGSPSHFGNNCFKGKRMTLDERKKKVESCKACNICLNIKHQAVNCPMKSSLKCNKCEGNHWALMCQEKSVPMQTAENISNSTFNSTSDTEEVGNREQEEKSKTKNLFNAPTIIEQVVLSTMLVRIRNGKNSLIVRAAIDSGSHKTYLLTSLIKKLNLIKNGEERLSHELFGGQLTKEIIHNRYNILAENLSGTSSHSFNVLDQEQICHSVPKLENGPWLDELKAKGIELTDFGLGNTQIELLIGCDIADMLLTEMYKFKKNGLGEGLVALNYSIGWTIMGKISSSHEKSDATLLVQTLFVQELDVSNLWRLDIIGIEDSAETKKKEQAIEAANEHFNKTLTLNEEGRYQIALPFINGSPPLRSNRTLAENRLKSMTKKLTPELKIVYQEIFNKWETDGIIEKVPDNELDNRGHYLPHKAVLKPNSLTTPVRPVFDASAKEKKSMSLNDCLETGPNLLEITTSVLCRFRLRKIGILSDIEKAFLQLSIRPEDRDHLRFLWWEEGTNQKISVYRHRRVVFGLTCSSFLLAATINHILKEAPPEYENTVEILKNANYVDNCITSLEDEEAVINFKNEATKLLATGKLNLRGWEWNSPSNIQEKEISVLGLTWNLKEDTLTCDIMKRDIIDDSPITKRKILSIAHQIFDPIGFTIPLLICPKLYLQECWELKTGWDEELPKEISSKFRSWCDQLSKVKRVRIPRWLGYSNENSKCASLHIFSDASKLAYATCAFLRVENENGVSVNLVQAKSRIAPLKKLSIPRLELLGCLIGVRLSVTIKKDLNLNDIKCYHWTDSSNALYWIINEDQWGTYVWNRVSEIRKSSNCNSWRYVPGKMNPADLPSRGCNAKQLIESSWWEGPDWLKLPETQWPSEIVDTDEEVLKCERKRIVLCAWELGKQKTDTSRITKFTNNYQKMIRFVALMLRIFKNVKKLKKDRITVVLRFSELDAAEKKILVLIQNETFNSNEKALEQMDLFVDEDGILRVKTKIFLRDDDESFRTPAVLASKHPITKALIEYYHRNRAHAGTQTLTTILREKFWIIKSRVTIKNIVKNCIVCKRFSAKPFGTKPTYLPLNRVKDTTVFEVTGVDLAGHLFIQGGQKAWIVLFTCAVYRAIHLELVTSISTETFIQALRRFIARRVRPRIIYSDPGSNFVGTDNALKKLNWEEIEEFSSSERIQWIRIPPKAPWWGGWWERLIGMVKDLLKKVLGKLCLNYEEMITILCDCESIINTRPLTYISEDTSDLATLTPDMFLKESTKHGVVDLDHIDSKYLNQKRRERQLIMNELRQRFRIEYLAQLPFRKGDNETRPIEVGEIVLIADENKKKINWPLARVIEIYKGKGNKTRVARVKTSKSTIVRPVKKLIPLEIRPDEILTTGIESSNQEEYSSKVVTSESAKEKEEKFESIPIYTKSGRLVKQVDRFGQN